VKIKDKGVNLLFILFCSYLVTILLVKVKYFYFFIINMSTKPSFYEVNLFREEGFSRIKCKSCKRFFWSLEKERKICGDPPCAEYSFIGNSPMKKKLNLHEMRESFLSFFEKNSHKRIARYPVVARWRNDIFFTIASISCFQPWVLNRTIDPPANPLVMSQTCLRFNDIDNVGKSGRHLTLFEMMAHHCFNTKEKFIYFNDETVELCNEFLISLGISPEEVVYIEEQWAGGGNSGPCFEVIVRGNEIATLVFMMYDDLPNGKKKEMEMQVVDTGYGLERFTWLSLGTPNVYEAIFGPVLKKLKEEEAKFSVDPKILAEYSKLAGMINVESNLDLKELRRKVAQRVGLKKEEIEQHILPAENLYAICDHTKALMFMLNDGLIPSNVKAGYFARLLARRTLRSLKFLKLNLPLKEIFGWQIDFFKDSFPELGKNKEDILKIVDVEEKKYEKTVKKGGRIVAELEERLKSKSREKISTNDLIKLYDTYGLTPELVKEFSHLKVNIPDDFYIQVALKHEKIEGEEKEGEGEKEEEVKIPGGIPDTKLGFYEDAKVKKFKAKVIGKVDNWIILDKTYFYAEGGGQEGDFGRIDDFEVIDTQKKGGVILHKVRGGDLKKVKLGKEVNCEINWERRLQLMQHHTAAHIINGSCKRILGNHVWQAGAHKSEKLGRLDITHYESLSDDQLKKIEEAANKVVKENREIEIKFMPRDEAERKFGFGIYQGGAVPGKIIRIVNIKNWDVEACGGTHFNKTGEVGEIKLIRAKRIQDGVIRLEFKSGGAFREYREKISSICEKIDLEKISEDELKKIASIFSVSLEQLPKTIERFQAEWMKQKDEIIAMEKQILDMGGGEYSLAKKYKNVICVDSHREAERLFEEWKSQKKDIKKLQTILGKLVEERIKRKIHSDFIKKEGVKIVKELLSGLEVKNLAEIAKSCIEDNSVIIIASSIGKKASIAVSSKSKMNAFEIADEISKKLGGGAHGDEKLGIGGGSSENIKKVFREI
jgi:alanyl-tRNA synthetase